MASITIPKGVTSIGDSVFYGCTGLTKITWNAKSVNDFTYKSSLFYNAGSDAAGIDVVFGNDVENIPAYMFYPYSGSSTSSYTPKITSVTIGENVTSIGSYAFYYCSNLEKVNITDIIAWCDIDFYHSLSNPLVNAKNLYLNNELITELIIPDGVTEIKKYAFYNCKGLTSVAIPESVTAIGYVAFCSCTGLTSITMPKNVTTIGDSAFNGCTGLTKINWNAKNVADFTSSGDAFGCAGTKGDGIDVVFGDSVEHIPAYLFYEDNYSYNSSLRPKITSVHIGKNVSSIGSDAFCYCDGLTSITIPDGVITIGNSTFYGCSGLQKVTIGKNVTEIDKSVFNGCDNITELTIPFVNGQERKDLSLTFGSNIKKNLTKLTLTNETTITEREFKDYENLTDIALNDGITSIGESAFSNCGYVNDETNWDGECLYLGNYLIGVKPTVVAVSVKDGTTVMSDNIFEGCTDLLKVTLPESMINISNCAFSGCTDLFSITLPGKINAIGKSAFYNCNKITKINIPSTVTKIGYSAFYGCNKLAGVYINDIGAWCKIVFGGDDYWDGRYSNPLCYAGSLYINDVLAENIVIPENITQLNNYVFYNCDSLKTIKLPDNLTSIGDYAFSSCGNLQSISIPSKVTSIGESAFSDCRALNTVSIPKSVTGIGDNAFLSCWNIDNVYIEDLSVWCKLDFEENDSNPLRYGANLYLNNTLVKELSIPSDITAINKNQFYNCGSITAVKIHSKVEKIEENAFYGCENIEYVEIPKDLFYIRNNAFYGCDSLAEVHYGGAESEWEEIIIADGNDSLKNARVQSIYYITLIDDDGNTSSITCLPNEKIKISDIEKKYMHKVTLYTDEAMTKEFDTTTAITANMTLYVKLGEEITVIYGDIDDDGEITMNDAIYLFNAVMFPEQYPISAGQKTDYNGDGKFDMNDAIYLFNHAMFPEQYPI